ncbi:MAG: hypothetical protein AMJ43_09570 [Coxiella sp. DG_40]|nr:MAG: hypothetical protein AMJ43_09570 [Coxiella sp. DG_40]
MYRLIAYLGILASIILGGILGLFASVLAIGVLQLLGVDFAGSDIKITTGIALGASIGGILAVVRVRRYFRQRRETQLVKHLASVPENAGELIKSIIREMRYRKKVRQEVMAELAAHFEDEVRDCKSDEEKEQKAQQLIADFGDVKLLGVLLRRAKKRCRPLWRTIVARTFQTLGVLILCLIVYLVWFVTGKPVVTVDYVAELNRIVRPVADESLNAAALYHKAAQLYGKPSDDFLLFFAQNYKAFTDEKFPHREKDIAEQIRGLFAKDKNANFNEERQKLQERVTKRLLELLSKKYNEVTPEQKQLIEKWLESNNEALELVIAGSKKPYYWPKYETGEENTGEVMAVLLPHLSEFRKLVYALRWRAWLSVEDGRYEDAFSDIKSCYRFGQHIKGDKSLIEQLVGIAFESLTVRTLRSILSEHKIDSSKLVELQQDFERMTADENFTLSLKFGKLCMYDAIQRCFTEDRLGGGHLSLDGLRLVGSMTDSDLFEFVLEGRHWTTPLHILFTHPNKRESREMTDSYYEFWDEIVHKTPIIRGNLLMENLTPALGRINEISHRTKSEIEVTLTIIAILRYKQDIGSYPENLDKLIEAGLLKASPIDPYSDKPTVYRKTDNNFTVYSVGLNFRDDGGKVAEVNGRLQLLGTEEEGDWVFWPVPKSEIKK